MFSRCDDKNNKVFVANVDYQVVFSFVAQDEKRTAITDALGIIKKIEYKVGSKMFHGGQMKKLNPLEIFFCVSMFTLML